MVLVAALSCREFAWITLERKTKRDDSGWDMIEQVERGSIGIHDTSEEETRVKTPGRPKDLGRSSVHGDWVSGKSLCLTSQSRDEKRRALLTRNARHS